MISKSDKNQARKKRHYRMRKNLNGTNARPRLNVFRSLQHIYAQIIDDENQNTIVSASTMDEALKGKFGNGGNVEAAKAVGKLVAERALEKGIKAVVFDRGGFLYHGRIKVLAEAAREAGLEF